MMTPRRADKMMTIVSAEEIIIFIIFVLVTTFLIYSFIETNFLLEVKHLNYGNKLKIVFISDLHFHIYTLPFIYKEVLEVVKKEKPDLIVVGGDIASFRHLEDKYETFFKELAKYGKVIMVCGYWDYYSQVCSEKEIEKLKNIGVTVLRNQYFYYKGVCFYGLDGLNPKKQDKTCDISIIHNPKDIKYVTSKIVLAGHTHGGQIIFFSFLRPAGIFKVNGKKLIITRGIGTTLVPIRFLCPPEVMVIYV